MNRLKGKKLWGVILFGCASILVFICLVFFWDMIRRPYYLDLAIPSPISHLTHGDWSNTQYATQVWTESGARYFIVRQESSVFSRSTDPEHTYRSWEEIIGYFDTYLTASGWQEEPASGYAPCNNFLPETNFLPKGENGYLTYVRKENFEANKWTQPVVCLAVWPYSETQGEVDSYNVVLLTANPSSWAEWLSEF